MATRPTIPVLLPLTGSLLLPDNEQIIEFHLNHCTHFSEKSKHNKLINTKATFERPLFYLKKRRMTIQRTILVFYNRLTYVHRTMTIVRMQKVN